jgi:hypothetical protein
MVARRLLNQQWKIEFSVKPMRHREREKLNTGTYAKQK